MLTIISISYKPSKVKATSSLHWRYFLERSYNTSTRAAPALRKASVMKPLYTPARMPSSLRRKVLFPTVVQHKHQSSADAPEAVCNEALVHTCRDALFCCNLLEAVHGALVDVLLYGQLGLHLQATSNGIERVADTGASNDRSLS